MANCQNPGCTTPLSGKQQRFCSARCQIQAYDKAHPDKARARVARYQKTAKGQATQNRREHSDKRKEYKREYSRTETGKAILRTKMARRVSREKGVEATLTPAEWKHALTYFKNKCAYCGDPLDTVHQEHFIPLSKGGGYTKGNIVPACPICNKEKRDRHPFDYLPANVLIRVQEYFATL